MSFTNNKAIFEQIADRLADEIMAENYPPGGRIPSVREYAALLQVNTNTAIKGYELLAREGIIFNKRGMGYFVAEDARHHIAQRRQEEFMETTLPELFRQMRLLNIGIDEVAQKWEESKKGIIPASSPLLSGGEETQQEILKQQRTIHHGKRQHQRQNTEDNPPLFVMERDGCQPRHGRPSSHGS